MKFSSLVAASTAIFVAACGSENSTVAKKEAPHPNVEMPQKWRVQCKGASGTYGVPIFWELNSFDERTGRVRGVVIDADGYRNTFAEYGVPIFIDPKGFEEINAFGVYAPITNNGKNFKLDIIDKTCPNGMSGEKVS
jgi:hypothetical protein